MDETQGRRRSEWAINEVEIVLVQTRVYENGRQQARIRLRLQAILNGQVVRLTDTERQNIRMFDYEVPESQIPFSDDGSSHHRGWSAQRTYRGYTFYPGLVLEKTADAPASPADGRAISVEHTTSPSTENALPKMQGPSEWLEFYVSVRSGAESRLMQIAFAIHGDDGSTWRTNGFVSRPGEAEEYYRHLDLYHGVAVSAEPPVLYSADNFQLDRRSLAATGHPLANGLFNDLVAVSIVESAGRTVGIREMECVPAGMIHWINDMPDNSNPCYTGYVPPGETRIRWNSAVPTGAQPRPELAPAQQNRGAFVLCGRVDIRRGDYLNPPTGPLALGFIDEYGTRHDRHLIFKDKERDELNIQ